VASGWVAQCWHTPSVKQPASTRLVSARSKRNAIWAYDASTVNEWIELRGTMVVTPARRAIFAKHSQFRSLRSCEKLTANVPFGSVRIGVNAKLTTLFGWACATLQAAAGIHTAAGVPTARGACASSQPAMGSSGLLSAS
jgi:hypothetical protein